MIGGCCRTTKYAPSASLSVNPSWIVGPEGAVEVRPDLPPLETWVFGYGPATDAGELGLAAVFGVVEPEQDDSTAEWFVEFSRDGAVWSRLDFPKDLGRPQPFVSPAVGSDRILLLVRADDQPALVVGVMDS